MNLTQVFKIARREYLARVRNKAFIIMTLMVPAFLVVYIFVMPRLFKNSGAEKLTVAILDQGTGLSEEFAKRLGDIEKPRVQVSESRSVAEITDEARREFGAGVRSETLDGYFVLVPDQKIRARARYYARETGNPIMIRRLEEAFQLTVLDKMLEGTGANVDQVRALQRSDLETFTVSAQGEEEGGFEVAFYSTLAFGMLLYMAVLINGQGMAMAIVEEKSSRLIEVILGAVTATEFMMGKILGVLASGLTQLLIWVTVALVAIIWALPALALGASVSGVDLTTMLNPTLIFYFSIFFALGYLLYTTVFATVASTCSGTEELSQAMFPAMLPIIIAFMATFYAVPNPASVGTRVLSLIPFFTPLVMLARVNVLMPPLWEVWLSIVLLLLCAVLVAWVAAKIFRFTLLMYGKRPSIPEIARMVRSSSTR